MIVRSDGSEFHSLIDLGKNVLIGPCIDMMKPLVMSSGVRSGRD